ncbi:MAG: YCF48-related protein, partial [Bacteroidetes bacterium]|nr:YCF48-related protein [Bacteroidota bacterium]
IGCATIEGMTPYFYTTDGGENWYLDDEWLDIMGDDIVFVNPDTGFIASADGVIYKTINGGLSWTAIQTPATQDVNRLFFVDENNGWATLANQDANFQLIHTTDGGYNWSTQQVFEYNISLVRSLYFINDSIGYGGGGYIDIENNDTYSCIVKTQNKGETWESTYLTQNTFYSFHDLYFTDTITGWVVGKTPYEYLILHTNNGGETWEEQTIADTPEPSRVSCVFFVNNTIGWIGGGGPGFGVIYFTHNGGEDWYLQQLFYEPIWDIQMLNCDTGWAVGADYIYHTTNGDTLSIEDVKENKFVRDLFTINPNPANGFFTLKTTQPLPTLMCQLLITNLYGEPVFQLNKVTVEQLNNQAIDLSHKPTGIYFITIKYTLNNQIYSLTKKIMRL